MSASLKLIVFPLVCNRERERENVYKLTSLFQIRELLMTMHGHGIELHPCSWITKPMSIVSSILREQALYKVWPFSFLPLLAEWALGTRQYLKLWLRLLTFWLSFSQSLLAGHQASIWERRKWDQATDLLHRSTPWSCISHDWHQYHRHGRLFIVNVHFWRSSGCTLLCCLSFYYCCGKMIR